MAVRFKAPEGGGIHLSTGGIPDTMAKEIAQKELVYPAPKKEASPEGEGVLGVNGDTGASSQGEDSKDDTKRSRRTADEKRNDGRKEECKRLKTKLIEEFTSVQQLLPQVGFISRAGDLIIYISYPANMVAKISLPSPRREIPMVVVYDQAFRRVIASCNSTFLHGFVTRYVC